MIKSSLDFLGLWWELGHPTFPNQHFRALGSSIILDRGFRKLEFFILSDIGILFHQQKSTIFHHNPLLFFFALRNYVGSMIPLGIHQLKKILRDLSSGSVKACGPFIVPWRCPGPWETRHWCRLMRENDDDTWCYNPHWIGMNMGWLGCFLDVFLLFFHSCNG